MIETRIPSTENPPARKITIPTQEEIYAPDLAEFYRSLSPDQPPEDQSLPQRPLSLNSPITTAMYPVEHIDQARRGKKSAEDIYSDTSDEGEFPPTTLFTQEDL